MNLLPVGLASLGLALTAVAAQRSGPVVVEVPGWGLPAGVMGATLCSTANEPVVFLRAGMDSALRARIMVHEGVHVRQARVFGDCHAAQARYARDPDARLDSELEAYCADVTQFLQGQNRDEYPDLPERMVRLLLLVTQYPDSAEVARRVSWMCPLLR